MYLFSNEGEQEISTRVMLAEKGSIIAVNLWNGVCTIAKPDFELCLQPRETMLAIVDEEQALEREIKPEQSKVYLGNWTEKFVLAERKANEAIYTMQYDTDVITGGEFFTVEGEEMVECYCNGEFVDVSFWGMHTFVIGSYLHKGVNSIELVFTGNAANIYCEAEIRFGIAEE